MALGAGIVRFLQLVVMYSNGSLIPIEHECTVTTILSYFLVGYLKITSKTGSTSTSVDHSIIYLVDPSLSGL